MEYLFLTDLIQGSESSVNTGSRLNYRSLCFQDIWQKFRLFCCHIPRIGIAQIPFQ